MYYPDRLLNAFSKKLSQGASKQEASADDIPASGKDGTNMLCASLDIKSQSLTGGPPLRRAYSPPTRDSHHRTRKTYDTMVARVPC